MVAATTEINLFSPDFIENPYRFYAEMRRNRPVCQVQPNGLWAVSRYGDAALVLKTPQLFSSAAFRALAEPPWLGTENPGAYTMMMVDPPEHTRKRNLVNRSFVASVLARTEPFIVSLAERLLDGLEDRAEVECVSDFAVPLVGGVIGHFLALDPALTPRFKRWSDDMTNITPTPLSAEHAERVRATLAELKHYMTNVVEERRRNPGDDLVSLLFQAEVDGQRLEERELIGTLFLLLVAGLETTVHLLSKSLLLLSQRTDLMERLRAAPSLIPAFVDEMLRYDPPTHNLVRQALQDAELSGGVKVPAGAYVLVMLASANRDEAQFPDPDTFNLDRGSQGGLAFGHGPHVCIGSGLARMEVRIALTAWLKRFTRFDRVPGPLEWHHTLTVRGPTRLALGLVRA